MFVLIIFQGVLEQYNRHVKPAFDIFIAPSMVHADIIVPRGGENEVAIDLIVNHVQVPFAACGFQLGPNCKLFT